MMFLGIQTYNCYGLPIPAVFHCDARLLLQYVCVVMVLARLCDSACDTVSACYKYWVGETTDDIVRSISV